MHEIALVQHLIATVQEATAGAGARGRITAVSLSVGRLSCASPEALRNTYEILASGTPLEGSTLIIDTPPAVARCRRCNGRTEADDLFCACPRCGSLDVDLEGGRDLILTSIDVEETEGEGEVDGHEDHPGAGSAQSQ